MNNTILLLKGKKKKKVNIIQSVGREEKRPKRDLVQLYLMAAHNHEGT